MKGFAKISLCAAVIGFMSISPFLGNVEAKAAAITTTGTGYTCAEDVVYKKTGSYIHNWGARGEDCTFLSSYAEDFYTGSYTYENLSTERGGTTQSNASSSDLYKKLKTLMTNAHDYIIGYQATRDLYKYTDCLRSNNSKISSFYSGTTLNGEWDGGNTWNREHCWPRSKCINQSKAQDSADIMMLRPTSVNENSSRGNTAYGESGGYYDPGESTRGDCARIVLYGYVRWGNTGYMWGSSGVMENMNVLLEWMAEDPVDTWEMGRNDAVQAITGTRNVFVDYPEYAWQLFGKSMPDGVSTPSGEESTTDPDDGNQGGDTTDPDDGNQGGGTTDPDDGNQGGDTTNPDDGSQGGDTTNPDDGSQGGDTTDPDDGNQGGDTTNPDDGNQGGDTTDPDDGNQGGDTTNPDDGNQGGDTTDPDDGNQGGDTTDPDDGNQGGDTTDPDDGNQGGDTTNPDDGNQGGGSTGGGNLAGDNPEQPAEGTGGVILAGGCKAAVSTSAGGVLVALLGACVLKRKRKE